MGMFDRRSRLDIGGFARKPGSLAAAIFTALAMPGHSTAQQPDARPAAEAETIESIVVTARRREEGLQEEDD